MKKMKEMLLAGAACAAVGMIATAQDRPQTPPSTPPATPPRETPPRETPPRTTTPPKTTTGMPSELLRATKFISTDVTNNAGENLGEINNLAVEMDSGEIRYAVLSFGGVLNIGDKLFAIPWESLEFAKATNTARLNIDKAKLESAPGFDKNDWPDFANRQWETDIHKHYGEEPYWQREAKDEQKSKDVGNRVVKHTIIRASDALDMEVENAQKQEIGEVEDLMLDLDNGRVLYSVVAFKDDVVAEGDKLFIVPWKTAGVREVTGKEHDLKFVLNVERERLAQMPNFDENNWPNLASNEWRQKVTAFYGEEDNWVYGFDRETGEDQPAKPDMTKPGKPSGGAGAEPKFDATKIETVSGTLVAAPDLTASGGDVMLTISEDSGKTSRVQLAPATYIKQQAVQMNANDKVTIRGYKTTIGGQEVIIAKELTLDGHTIKFRDDNGKQLWSSTPRTGGTP